LLIIIHILHCGFIGPHKGSGWLNELGRWI